LQRRSPRRAVGRHARAILGLSDPEAQEAMASRVVAEGLSVRGVEEAVQLVTPRRRTSGSRARPRGRRPVPARLGEIASASPTGSRRGSRSTLGRTKGKVVIEFASIDDLERIVQVIDGTATAPAAPEPTPEAVPEPEPDPRPEQQPEAGHVALTVMSTSTRSSTTTSRTRSTAARQPARRQHDGGHDGGHDAVTTAVTTRSSTTTTAAGRADRPSLMIHRRIPVVRGSRSR
jgi:hypothetical protein